MFFEGRNLSADMMDEMFQLAHHELRESKFQPVAMLVKTVRHFAKGRGARQVAMVRRSLSVELKS
jgi:hypothetical protein